MNISLFKRGMTLLEVMMSLTIFVMLLGLITYIYTVSSKSWLKVRQQIDVKDNAQITMVRIMREIRGSARKSVTIISYPNTADPNCQAISFLSSYDDTSHISDYDTTSGKMVWTKYVLFYLKDDENVVTPGYYQLMRREIDVSNIPNYSTTVITNMPFPPTSMTGNTKEMYEYIEMVKNTYVSTPTTVSRNITRLNFTRIGSKIEITVNTGKPLKPNSASSPASPEKVNLTGIVVLRNSN